MDASTAGSMVGLKVAMLVVLSAATTVEPMVESSAFGLAGLWVACWAASLVAKWVVEKAERMDETMVGRTVVGWGIYWAAMTVGMKVAA